MNTLHSIYVSMLPVLLFLADCLMWVLDALRPNAELLVTGVIGVFAQRWFRNKQVADAFVTGAGVAYNSLGAQYAATGKIDFETAKAAALEAGRQSIQGFAAKKLQNLTSEMIVSRIDGALGKLLAQDPSFNVTAPSSTLGTPAAPINVLATAVP